MITVNDEDLEPVDERRKSFKKHLYKLDIKKIKELYDIEQQLTYEYNKRKLNEQSYKYILNQLNGIINLLKEKKNIEWNGVCAEGQVSHVISSRLSTKGFTWSKKGVNNMCKIHSLLSEGFSVEKIYMLHLENNLNNLPKEKQNQYNKRQKMLELMMTEPLYGVI